MGWGIRGQYGHETGAMIAGVLVGFVLVLFYLPNASSLKAARTVALLALGVSFGGSMTYGQTIGLTHDAPLIGNWSALCWGLCGLFIKGGIWIGFAGAFLGLALSGKRYQPWELLLVMLAMLVLWMLGIWLINTPYDPANKVLPSVYFSDSWKFEPDGELKPRREIWGGLFLALVGLTSYFHLVRRDLLARNMALIGFLSGGFGFPIGQSVQAFHAWNPELYRSGWLGKLDPFMNWWNMMETSFGAIFGGLLAGGLWLNRHLIIQDEPRDQVVIKPIWEFALFEIFLILLVGVEFVEVRMISLFLEFGFIMALIPSLGILERIWNCSSES